MDESGCGVIHCLPVLWASVTEPAAEYGYGEQVGRIGLRHIRTRERLFHAGP
jgi:hypothetical protein